MKRNILLAATVAVVLVSPALAVNSVERISAVDHEANLGTGGPSCPNGETPLLVQAPNQSNGLFSDANCAACGTGQQSIAEDFVLAADATIGQIVMWGGYFPGNQIPNPADSFTVIFHSDSASLPGGSVASETLVPTSAVTTGVTLFGVSELEIVFDITPVALTAGTYWVEIFTNSTGTTDQFFWEVGNLDGTNGRLNNAFSFSAPGAAWNTGNPVADVAVVLCPAAVVVVPDESILAIPTLGTIGLVTMVLLLLATGVFLMARRRQNG
ncbi:MAG: hypothetical protein R2862_08200 [Thermoanaerobaculia bacterium]